MRLKFSFTDAGVTKEYTGGIMLNTTAPQSISSPGNLAQRRPASSDPNYPARPDGQFSTATEEQGAKVQANSVPGQASVVAGS